MSLGRNHKAQWKVFRVRTHGNLEAASRDLNHYLKTGHTSQTVDVLFSSHDGEIIANAREVIGERGS